MEKIGDALNQLAIISDLMENINIESSDKKIIFVVDEKEFKRIYSLILEKSDSSTIKKVKNHFTINIGEIEILFSMNSV